MWDIPARMFLKIKKENQRNTNSNGPLLPPALLLPEGRAPENRIHVAASALKTYSSEAKGVTWSEEYLSITWGFLGWNG